MSKNKRIVILAITCIVLGIFGGLFILQSSEDKVENDHNIIVNKENIEDVIIEKKEDANIIGYLTINSINLNMIPIAEGTDMNVLNKYLGHFEETGIINGNIAICGHNRGYENNYFENLKNVNNGDLAEYKTKNSVIQYMITNIRKIEETDLDVLKQDGKDKLTLITCVENEPQYRYCVTADKVEEK